MKKIWMLLLLPLCFGFMACGNDEESENTSPAGDISEEQLIGLWEMTYIKGWYYDEDNDDNVVKRTIDMEVKPETLNKFYEHDISDYVRYQFLSGKKFKNYTYIVESGTWKEGKIVDYKIEGRTIILAPGRGTEEQVTVINNPSKELVLHNYDPEEFDLTITLKKIN